MRLLKTSRVEASRLGFYRRSLVLRFTVSAALLFLPFTAPAQISKQRRPLDAETIRYYSKARSLVDLPPGELVRAIPELKKLKPAASQQDLPIILGKVGANVAAFFRNFPNTTSVEQLQQEILGPTGMVERQQLEKFHYLIIATHQGGPADLEEYRTDNKGRRIDTQSLKGGFLLTQGFAADSIFFDTAFQANSRFRYLGRERRGDGETFVVAFAQNPRARPVVEIAQMANESAVILVQGVAWIDPATYQILHLRTDLLAPPPFLDIEKQTTEIEYGQVQFKGLPDTLWLPRRVMVTAEWNGQIFRNLSSYSKYHLFKVNAKLRR
jgi:hypothetical protein